jgi:hypothetical protein
MFLIAVQNITPDQAIQAIRKIRPIAFTPGANFRESIEGCYRSYQRDIVPTAVNKPPFK